MMPIARYCHRIHGKLWYVNMFIHFPFLPSTSFCQCSCEWKYQNRWMTGWVDSTSLKLGMKVEDLELPQLKASSLTEKKTPFTKSSNPCNHQSFPRTWQPPLSPSLLTHGCHRKCLSWGQILSQTLWGWAPQSGSGRPCKRWCWPTQSGAWVT